MLSVFWTGLKDASPDVKAALITLLGAVLAAWWLYRSTLVVARRNLLVGTVTTERATWRSELRNASLDLADAAIAALNRPGVDRRAAVHRYGLAIRLRLNPSRADDHLLDREITDAIQALELALERDQMLEARMQLGIIENRVQRL